MASAHRYLEAIEEISFVNGVNWDDNSKLTIISRFLEEEVISFKRFEDFCERQATEELAECTSTEEGEDDEEDEDEADEEENG